MNMPLKTAVYSNTELSNEDYHADRDFVSSSGLKLIPGKEDEFIARYMMSHKLPERSEALKFGGGLHSAILEPDIFPTEYVIEPEVNRRTNAGKDELKEFYKSVEAEGKTVLTPEDMALIRAMRGSVNQHPIASSALNGAEREKSFFLAGDYINQKVRLDAYKNNIIMDVKSCESIDKFYHSAAQYRYGFSEQMYRTVVEDITGEPTEFMFIAIQKSYPYTVAVFRSTEEVREKYARQYQASKDRYIQLKDSGMWGDIRDLHLPDWAKDKTIISGEF